MTFIITAKVSNLVIVFFLFSSRRFSITLYSWGTTFLALSPVSIGLLLLFILVLLDLGLFVLSSVIDLIDLIQVLTLKSHIRFLLGFFRLISGVDIYL